MPTIERPQLELERSSPVAQRLLRFLIARAPDLRQTSTHELTDGQLHYIIAYGVRYTGVPAHHAPSGDAWKLVSFIRTLRPFVAQESSELANSLATAHYFGSEA